MWIYDYIKPEDNPYSDPPFVPIVHMCYMDNQPQWNYPFHKHAGSYELAWITCGSGELVLDDLRLPVKKGSVTVVPPDVLHYFRSDDTDCIKYYTIRFQAADDGSPLQGYFRELGVAAAEDAAVLPYILETFRLLFELHQENGGVVDATFQSIAMGLIHLSQRTFRQRTPSVTAAEHEVASEILRYIMSTDGKGITLESLAKKFSISPSHLSRIFANAYHVSPINYAINARITFSTEYLLKTDKTIVEIAELVGYDNPTHFSNMFIKRIGCTPTEFRERNRRIPTGDA